jgi:hypothetical protein
MTLRASYGLSCFIAVLAYAISVNVLADESTPTESKSQPAPSIAPCPAKFSDLCNDLTGSGGGAVGSEGGTGAKARTNSESYILEDKHFNVTRPMDSLPQQSR